MRTSLNDIQTIEHFLGETLSSNEKIVLESRLLAHPELTLQIRLQRKIYRLVKLFHRKKVKQEIEKIHNDIFSDPAKTSFQQQIFQLFNS